MFVFVFFRFCLGGGSEFGGAGVFELSDAAEEGRGVKVGGGALEIGLGATKNVDVDEETALIQVFEDDVVAVEVDKEAVDTCVGVWFIEEVAIVDGL